jgi:hypothetical protein
MKRDLTQASHNQTFTQQFDRYSVRVLGNSVAKPSVDMTCGAVFADIHIQLVHDIGLGVSLMSFVVCHLSISHGGVSVVHITTQGRDKYNYKWF